MSTAHSGIRGLHHTAFRVRDSEETRRFYEDFLGLRLATSLEIESSEPIDRTAVAAALLAELDRCFAHPERLTEADLRAQWLERSQPSG